MHPIVVRFPGGKRVDAECAGHVIHTDQPSDLGGDGSAPEPFTLFLAALATCAGYYVLAFCNTRGISMQGIGIALDHEKAATGRLQKVRLSIDLPPGFPEKYIDGVRRAADSCKVKKVLLDPPTIDVMVGIRQAAA
jgi:ribosomal protein S12 methylthiotransferase accessory factor